MEKRPRIRFDLQGFPTTITRLDHGRGNLAVVEVTPPGLSPEKVQDARLQVFVRGFSHQAKPELPRVLRDLRILAGANQNQEEQPIVTAAVVFMGDRNYSGELVGEGSVPTGVRLTHHHYEMALDVRDSFPLIEANNAEIIGHSTGGPIAQAARHVGLPVDMIGLVNTAGLIDFKSGGQAVESLVRQTPTVVYEKVVDTLLGIHEHPGEIVVVDKSILSLLDEDQRAAPSREQKLADHRSMRRSWTRDLIPASPDTLHVVGKSRADALFPESTVRNEVSQLGNVVMHRLPWRGHGLGRLRSTRLTAVAEMMREARQKAS